MIKTIFHDLGLIEYREAWQYQEQRFDEVIQSKLNHIDQPGYLLFCEHPHVFTLGKSGEESNFLIHQDFLKQIGATYFQTNRGWRHYLSWPRPDCWLSNS